MRERAKEILRKIGYKNASIICKSDTWEDYCHYYASLRSTTPIKNEETYRLIKEYYYVLDDVVYERKD